MDILYKPLSDGKCMIAIFDFFGVVVDWKSDYVIPVFARYAGISDAVVKQKMKIDFALCDTGKISVSELFLRLGKSFRVDPSGLEGVFRECLENKAKLNTEVVKVIQSLPDAVLLSNQMPLHTEFARSKGWFSCFSRLFFSFEIGFAKPSPESYLFVLKALGVRPEDSVFVDDKQENVDGAVSVGMRAVLFKDANQLSRELSKFYKLEKTKK